MNCFCLTDVEKAKMQ